MTSIQGTAAAEGVAQAKAFVLAGAHTTGTRTSIQPEQAAGEKAALKTALEKTAAEIKRLQQAAYADRAQEQGDIFSAYLEIIRDEELVADVEHCITEKNVDLNTALMDVCNEYAADMAALDDPYMQARADDFRQIFRMISDMHTGKLATCYSMTEDFILAAYEVGPADMAKIDRRFLKGIVTEIGSRTSHAAIVCRAAGIPMVSGIRYDQVGISTGTPLIIDGTAGVVHINPDVAVQQVYTEKIRTVQAEKERIYALKAQKGRTADGTPIVLTANAGTLVDLDAIVEHNAEGIGLFRTEFLFMENPARLPSEDEQFHAYKTVVETLNPKPVVFRTLDAGGDKHIEALGIPKEENPFLGWRAIRYCLKNPELFRMQLRALLRASRFGNCSIMLPMISSEHEVIQAKKLLDSVYEELEQREHKPLPRVPLGIMIETPAAALIAETLAAHVDFFSIGSNDLTQYTVAADRGNEYVADVYNELHPAVLHLIGCTVQAAKKSGIRVHICGEMAGDTRCTEALLHVGIRELSMSANRIPYIKEHLLTLHGA